MFDKEKYAKQYYKKNKAKIKKVSTKYAKNFLKTKTMSLGDVICPDCKKQGTLIFLYKYNKKTKTTSGHQFLVNHSGKSCYIGMAKKLVGFS